jgi:glycosyltransferase involved in cell wall biosynthesis
LASKGHEVYVFSEYGRNEVVDGVHYVEPNASIPKWDVAVFNRNVLPNDFVRYSQSIGAKNIWWLHDIVQLTYLPDATYKTVDKIVALSNYCKTTYSDFYSIPEDKFVVIPNGVDDKLWFKGPYEDRDPRLWVMASAPVKGMLPVANLYDNLKRHVPTLDFRIYSNQSLHGRPNLPEHDSFLRHMADKGARIQAPIPPKMLAELLRKAWCFVLPNSYPEICSNLLLQAQASGCPVLTSDIGANPEFIKNGETGVMTTKFKPHDLHAWVTEFTRLGLKVLLDGEGHKKISEQSSQEVKTWEQVGEAWNAILQSVSN